MPSKKKPAQSPTDVVLNHPDKDELISKLLQNISPADITKNLEIRYGDIDKNLIVSEKTLETFKKNSLNIYRTIQEDLRKTSVALQHSDADVQLTLKNNPTYRQTLEKLANNELDIKTMLANMILATETRIAQIFDQIQSDPDNVNSRTERLFNEYLDRFQAAIEKWQKYIIQSPDQIIQHNVSVQHIDNHMSVFHDAIRKVLSKMDNESALLFMNLYNEEINKTKAPIETPQTPVEERLAEVKTIHDQINYQLTDGYQA
jgi:hypothetical protein